MIHIPDIPTQKVCLPFKDDIELYIKREDLTHKYVSGNKYRKLKYNLKHASDSGYKRLLTFGGAYSNHISATAAAAQRMGLEVIGVIRGDELSDKVNENPTLRFAQECGMKFHFVSRQAYRNKDKQEFHQQLTELFGDFYLVPEGGTNALAVKGCQEILNEQDTEYDFITSAVGTGGTISGIINSAKQHQKVLGFPALKGNFLEEIIRKYTNQPNWELIDSYHFGGYAKYNTELIEFLNDFHRKTSIPLDPIYTGKMIFGICDMINKGYFPKKTKILAIHTGGLQGIQGFNKRIKDGNKLNYESEIY